MITGLLTNDRALAQGTYIPPDIFGDAHQGTCMIRKNSGQVLDSDLQQRPEIKGYFEASPIGIYLCDKSKVSFTLAAMHHDSVTPDTLYRVDMVLSKRRERSPNYHYTAPGLANYYRGSIAAEGVVANYRAVYKSIEDSIDCHFYGSRGGPRIAFVIRPGGNPSAIKLRFTGQDSLGIDWQGALKVYLQNKWVKLEQAVAYQVSGTTLIPVPWTGGYTHEEGTAYAGFTFGSYDPELPLVLQIGYPAMMGGGGPPEQRNLNWSTYAGGSGGDELECVEVDEVGDAYVCGYALGSFYPADDGFIAFTPAQGNPAGTMDAVVMKVEAATKETPWITYYGGTTGFEQWYARTKAHKLAVYKWTDEDLKCVFVTGSTTCIDFPTGYDLLPAFQNAYIQDYLGGVTRMWLGAFRKSNGARRWATTHGETGDATWSEHGLAIDVDQSGRLAVGGQLESFYNINSVVPQFPSVSFGNFNRPIGGGFFVVFNEDYEIAWATTFAEFRPEDTFSKITDLKIIEDNLTTYPELWLTGCSDVGSNDPFDVVPNQGAYFKATSNQPSAFIAKFNLEYGDLLYSTRWGGDEVSEGYGLEITSKAIWVVGYTNDTELTLVDCPDPGGPGVHHSTVHAGTTFSQGADGFILRVERQPHTLSYGTLIGGNRDDILLDVNSDPGGQIYITGETRSSVGFSTDLNTNYYFQPQQNVWNRRDGLILSIDDNETPTIRWRSAFGGTKSDRGWGIAASASEVFLVGATASQAYDDFPLIDFDPGNPFDLYQDWNLEGTSQGEPWVPFYQFCGAMDHEFTQWGIIESVLTQHDGFIASFGTQTSVGVDGIGDDKPDPDIAVLTLPEPGTWSIQLPESSAWTIMVFDALGRTIQSNAIVGTLATIDLRDRAAGTYFLLAQDRQGFRHSIKLIKP